MGQAKEPNKILFLGLSISFGGIVKTDGNTQAVLSSNLITIENNNDSETAKKLQQQQAFQLIVNGKVNAKVVSGKRCYQFPVLSPKCGRPLSQQYIEGQGGFTKYAGGLNPWGLEVKGVIERANYLYS
ncbi:UNVERIFIED_CONTAM: hypothetical protein HDU68_010086 [Siphonaria sp. JEL0065]|nr:hypothetical protein HDU68_010086 [Siphonaria sp. JEL0065]